MIEKIVDCKESPSIDGDFAEGYKNPILDNLFNTVENIKRYHYQLQDLSVLLFKYDDKFYIIKSHSAIYNYESESWEPAEYEVYTADMFDEFIRQLSLMYKGQMLKDILKIAMEVF